MAHEIPWTTHTIARLNARLGVTPDDDIGVEDWPEAMSDPALVDAALAAYAPPTLVTSMNWVRFIFGRT